MIYGQTHKYKRPMQGLQALVDQSHQKIQVKVLKTCPDCGTKFTGAGFRCRPCRG